MTKSPSWQQWEQEIAERWGLRATVCSGNQFQDPGDATSEGSPYDPFRLLVDCKHTDKKSFSLKHTILRQWYVTAMLRGKVGVFALRFEGNPEDHTDWVILSREDFEELWTKARNGI
jgi:hypothetical protein